MGAGGEGSADAGDVGGFDGGGAVFPFAAEVGEDAGDVFVGEREGGHFEGPGAAGDGHGAAEAVEDDFDGGVGGAEEPIAVEEGRGQAF